jgi:hypothetical protein
VADQDLLGRQGLVDALAAMFGDPQQSTPFTLAVLGDWGAGKSSLMNLVQRQLTVDQHSRFDFAWFNAWEYENTGNMPAGLAQEVVEALVGNMSRWDKVKLRFRFGAREHRWSLVRALFYTLAAVVPLATFAAVAAWIEENQLLESLLGVGAGAGLVVFGVQVFRSAKRLWEHPMAVELKTYLDLPSYGQHLGLIPVLKRHLRTLCELRLIEEAGKRRRLVCFVDDLDRCKPESITQTLEAIRLVMDLQNVIVMIGIDQRIAVQAVADQYHDLASPGRPREDIARDYLGKIVQLSIRLDRPDASNLQAFIEGVLFRGAEAGEHENTNHTAAEAEPHLRLVQPGPAPDTGLVAPAGRESAPAFADATKEPDGQLSSPEPDRSLFAEPSVPVDLTVAMTDTAEERDRFYELALAHGFFNPRQLTRIRNSYRLLKLLEAQVAQSSPGDLSHEQMMRMIFWQELLQAWPRHVRDGLGGWLLGHNPPKDLPAEARSAFQAVAQPLRDCLGTDEVARRATYDRCAAFASLLVLPRGD